MADQFSTEPGRFNYYKERLDEEKAKVPELLESSSEAIKLATQRANSDIFPPMGLINFNQIPEGVDEEKFIEFKVNDIIRGTIKYIHEFEYQPPKYLDGTGLTNSPIFENSEAVKNLLTKTKTDYNKISEEISNLEIGEETDFDNKEMSRLTSDQLHDLLSATILDFLKEIGIDRSEGEAKPNDDLILENSQKIYDFLTSSNNTASQAVSTLTDPDAVATKLEEPPVKINVSEKMEPVATSPILQKPIPTDTPQAAKTVTKDPVPVIEKTQTPVQQITPEVKLNIKSQSAPTAIATQSTPGTTNQPVEFAGEDNFSGKNKVANISSPSTPLLDLLASNSGMTSDEIAKMFQDENGGVNLQALSDISTPINPEVSTIEENIAKTSASNSVQALQQTQAAKVASVISEPTKMAEPVTPVATPQAPTQAEAPPAVSTPESAPQIEQSNTSTGDKKDSSTSENKTTADGKTKEEDPNAELLRVMRDVLKTLQGPLIVTDGRHNFS